MYIFIAGVNSSCNKRIYNHLRARMTAKLDLVTLVSQRVPLVGSQIFLAYGLLSLFSGQGRALFADLSVTRHFRFPALAALVCSRPALFASLEAPRNRGILANT